MGKILSWVSNLFKPKKINMITKKKLHDLKVLIIEIKNEIQEHHNNDPQNPDDFLNGQLYGLLEATRVQIEEIGKNNQTTI